jgi:hypothetical protein
VVAQKGNTYPSLGSINGTIPLYLSMGIGAVVHVIKF